MTAPLHPSQYQRGTQALLDPSPGALNTLDHFSCCDSEVGTRAPALCGTEEEVENGYTDNVDCLVCTWALKAGHCPRHGRCPY